MPRLNEDDLTPNETPFEVAAEVEGRPLTLIRGCLDWDRGYCELSFRFTTLCAVEGPDASPAPMEVEIHSASPGTSLRVCQETLDSAETGAEPSIEAETTVSPAIPPDGSRVAAVYNEQGDRIAYFCGDEVRPRRRRRRTGGRSEAGRARRLERYLSYKRRLESRQNSGRGQGVPGPSGCQSRGR